MRASRWCKALTVGILCCVWKLRGVLQETFLLLLYDVGSLGTFLAVYDVERYLLTLIECLEALALNCAEVNEYVLSVVYGDEAVPFALVEPLNSSLCHEKKAS